MESIVKQPKWKQLEYSRTQVINAGKVVRKDGYTSTEYDEAVKIVDNWRASHAFPLHIIYMNLRRMKTTGKNIIVAERLKRLDSIVNKLKREPNMNLWTMQDLGGCRVVVPTMEDVYAFADKYENSRKRHIKKKVYDYIKNPKQSGYRSLHVVYEYHSESNDKYNKNMLVEIQFRTHLQHLWATAVETMGLFTKEALKSGQGSEEVKYFFALVSTLFALIEGQACVPNTPNNIEEVVSKIKQINDKNNYLDFLSGIRVALDNQEHIAGTKKVAYCILILNYNTRRLNIKRFASSEFEEANNIYSSIESTKAESKIDAVLVRVSSFKELQYAYPNYFSDIGEFVKIVESYIL